MVCQQPQAETLQLTQRQQFTTRMHKSREIRKSLRAFNWLKLGPLAS
jgi:hypothetical protein